MTKNKEFFEFTEGETLVKRYVTPEMIEYAIQKRMVLFLVLVSARCIPNEKYAAVKTIQHITDDPRVQRIVNLSSISAAAHRGYLNRKSLLGLSEEEKEKIKKEVYGPIDERRTQSIFRISFRGEKELKKYLREFLFPKKEATPRLGICKNRNKKRVEKVKKTKDCCEITTINGGQVIIKSGYLKRKQEIGDKFFGIPFSAGIGEEQMLFLFIAHHCSIPNECYILMGKKGVFEEILAQILFSGNKNPVSYTDEPFEFIFSSRMIRGIEPDAKWISAFGRNVVITLKESQLKEDEAEKLKREFSRSIYDYDLSPRLLNCLEKLEIYSLKDLVQKTEADFKESRCGGRALKEVKEFLAELGLRLGMKE